MFRLTLVIIVGFCSSLALASPSAPRNLRLVPEAYRQLPENYPAIEDTKEIHKLAKDNQFEAIAVYFLDVAESLKGTVVEAKAQELADGVVNEFSGKFLPPQSEDLQDKIDKVMAAHNLEYRQAILVLGLREANQSEASQALVLNFATAVDQLSASTREIAE